MKTAISLAVLALCLMIGLPGAAEAGETTGACLADPDKTGADVPPFLSGGNGPPDQFSACIDGLTGDECESICFGPAGSDPGGGADFCEFLPDQTCASTGIPWDGACDAASVPPIGSVCVLIASPSPGDSQLLCEQKGQGTWLGDGSVCGGVPALPKLAYAALALVLLAGTLTILTLQSRS